MVTYKTTKSPLLWPGKDEQTREVEHYNLDMALALDFRAHSPVGVRFRRLQDKCRMSTLDKVAA